jgi:hypothetical protein
LKTTTIKWIIGIALLSIQPIAHSQNFINDNKQWANVTQPLDLNTHFTTYNKFSGDTIINGNVYHKLYSSTDSNQVNWTLDYYSFWWEKNDSVFQRCQHYGNINDTTMLLYDFNLEEGDTFHIDEYYDMMKVDSIRYLDFGDTPRKYWFFNIQSTYGYVTWIEGVGEWGNFSLPLNVVSSSSTQLLCFHENGNLVYQNPNFNSCYVNTTSVPSITKSQGLLNLFPNPATTQITLNLPENKANATYTLYDMQGRIQLTGKTSNTQTEINVATLPRGLYILKIITEKEIITKKIVLQ